MSNRRRGGRDDLSNSRDRDRDRDYSDDDDGGRDSPNDKLTRYRSSHRRSHSPNTAVSTTNQQQGLQVNVNVEQMISMVFEMRGSLAHEIEARRASEAALNDARQQIEQLRDMSQRDNNKWANLLGRVKELEVGNKLDNRLGEINNRAEKYARNNDQSKLLQVFQEIKSRLDGQEREYRESLSKISRDSMRDGQRLEHDLRAMFEQQMGKLDGQRQNDGDLVARLSNRLIELEKEFAIFMNAQVLMQQNINNKEKDGDWLKIYLTEQFNAQKHSVESKFKEIEHAMERSQDNQRIQTDKTFDIQQRSLKELNDALERKSAELSDQLEQERQIRDRELRKLQKALKTTVTSMTENLTKSVGVLDSKMLTIKTTQNEAISNLYDLVKNGNVKFDQHLLAFQDAMQIQGEQTAKEHSLTQRLESLEQVLKAEIKSRLKNHTKTKQLTTEMAKRYDTKIDEIQALTSNQMNELMKETVVKMTELKNFLHAQEEEHKRQEEQTRLEEEEHARLLNIAMETRSILDSMVGQVEEQHYVELRKHEWKAFGQVIELELKNRDEDIERKIASQGGADMITEKVEEVKHFVEQAFAEFEQHERLLKEEEEEQASMMNIAMESRAVLDSMITHIVDSHEASILHVISTNMKVLDERSQIQAEDFATLKAIVEQEHDTTSTQLTQTHGEVMRLAQELAARVDTHSQQLEAASHATQEIQTNLHEVEELVAKTLIDTGALKRTVDDLHDVVDLNKKDVTNLKLTSQELLDAEDATKKELTLQKTKVQDLYDLTDAHTKELKQLKASVTEATDTLAQQQTSLKTLQSSLADSAFQSQQQRHELEMKLQARVSETAANLSNSSAKIDELTLIIKRLDGFDRSTTELIQSTDTLSTKQLRMEQTLQLLQTLVDDSTLATDRKVKELRTVLESELETNELALKKLEKKLQQHQDDFNALSSEFHHSTGGSSAASKTHEEGLSELRAKVTHLAGVQDKLDSLQREIKELATQLDDCLPSEKHARDLKELNQSLTELEDAQIKEQKDFTSKLHDLEDHHVKDLKTLREGLTTLEEQHNKHNKDLSSRLVELETKIQHVGSASASKDDGHDASKRVVDASIVEKEVQTVSDSVEALQKKLKDLTNQHEDNLNRLQQDFKKMNLKVESLEAEHGESLRHRNAAAASTATTSPSAPIDAADSTATKKSLNDLNFRVDTLESEMKLQVVGGLTHQLTELNQKMEQRAREVDGKFVLAETRVDKIEAEMKSMNETSEETELKHSKKLKELQLAMDQLTQHETELQNLIKSESSKQALETDQSIKASETRTTNLVKALQKTVDQQEVDFKTHVRSIDEKLHDMQWSLEYAKDETFKKDAKEMRAGGAQHQPKAAAPPVDVDYPPDDSAR